MSHPSVVVNLIDAEPATFTNASIEYETNGVIIRESGSLTFFPIHRILSVYAEIPKRIVPNAPQGRKLRNSPNIGGLGI